MNVHSPRLSICISTFQRANFLAATLDSVLLDLPAGVELLLVDGASLDDTAEVASTVQARFPALKYIRLNENSGVDQDYDHAVRSATGDYCWLMTDDDLLKPGAVATVLSALDRSPDVLVVNAEVRNATLDCILDTRLLKLEMDRNYKDSPPDVILAEVGNYLSFIGGVVIRRSLWLARSDGAYFGTLFGHMGVIFGHPTLRSIYVVAKPLIVIRYGNAMWTSRGFEIWMFKFPDLVWSFSDFGDASKERVTARSPWRSFRKLVLYRGTGGYSTTEYTRFLRDRSGWEQRVVCRFVALMPAAVANFIAACYCTFSNPNARAVMYDLGRSRHATAASRYLAHRLLQ